MAPLELRNCGRCGEVTEYELCDPCSVTSRTFKVPCENCGGRSGLVAAVEVDRGDGILEAWCAQCAYELGLEPVPLQ